MDEKAAHAHGSLSSLASGTAPFLHEYVEHSSNPCTGPVKQANVRTNSTTSEKEAMIFGWDHRAAE